MSVSDTAATTGIGFGSVKPLLLACCVGVCSAGVVAQDSPQPPTIFVGPQSRDGFVDADKGITDSIKDLKEEIAKKKKALRLVPKRDDAQIVLEVISRGATSEDGGGSAAIPIGTTTMYVPIGTIGLFTLLKVGTYEKPIVFQNCEMWRLCAQYVVRDIEAWVDANAGALTDVTAR